LFDKNFNLWNAQFGMIRCDIGSKILERFEEDTRTKELITWIKELTHLDMNQHLRLDITQEYKSAPLTLAPLISEHTQHSLPISTATSDPL
jgi:hypothetical protein